MKTGIARARTSALIALAVTALGGAVATSAQAAAPAATTGGTANLQPTSVTLKGSVNPKSHATVYYFQYGTSKAYGSQTPEVGAGAGTATKAVTADVVSLTANKTYHYRIVARSSGGTTLGADKSFKTKKQPLGFLLKATPNPVTYGDTVHLDGVLGGTDNVGRSVQLQGRPFPYTAAFANIGNAQITGKTGLFSFPLFGVTTNTQYRVVSVGSPKVTSGVVSLGVAVDVATKTSTHTITKGHHVRFSGSVHPAKVGSLFAIQRQHKSGLWYTIAGGTSKGGGSTSSDFEKSVKIKYSGNYRVFFNVADGLQVSGIGRTIHISLRHHH
jgi:hypothetical protein